MPWDLNYQGTVNSILIGLGVRGMQHSSVLSTDELEEMGRAMVAGVSAHDFAARITGRAEHAMALTASCRYCGANVGEACKPMKPDELTNGRKPYHVTRVIRARRMSA